MKLPPLPPGSTIGIVGGGQLGRMSAMAAARLGYRCHVFAPEADSPAAQVAAAATVAPYDDLAAVRGFAESVDAVTFEFENISAAALDLLAALRPVHPSPALLRVSQDRLIEKAFVNAAGLRTVPWFAVLTFGELREAMAQFGLPIVLKTSRGGYDGRGQAVIRHEDEAAEAYARLEPKPLIAEGFCRFALEASVIVARGGDGATAAFDPVENRHVGGILDLTLAPARLAPRVAGAARRAALRLARKLRLVGLLAVEMFVERDGGIVVNEIAPRPHNSGHWTADACAASQFELHIRAVAGLPLADTARHSDAVMRNLIGPEGAALWPAVVSARGFVPHFYGKDRAAPGRKMGHVTRLFPRGALPDEAGIAAALAPLFRAPPGTA